VLIDQLEQYKWRKISSTSEDDPKEEPRKRNDHGVDALRYLIMSRPDIELIEIPTEDKIIDARVPSLDWQTLKKDKDKLKRMIKENPTEVLLKIFNDNA
jgi:hypothetical protein